MSHFDGKNWTRVDTEDGRIVVRVYEGTYAGPETDAVETYTQVDDVWLLDGEPVEDVDLVDDLDVLIAPVDLALEADHPAGEVIAPVAPEPEPEPEADPVQEDHVHGDETHVH